MLKFSEANAKTSRLYGVPGIKKYLSIRRKVYSLDLLSGWSCPFAETCLSQVVITADGKKKIRDGEKTKFRCFSASQEVLFPSVYNLRSYNFNRLRTSNQKVRLILDSLPQDIGVLRYHVGGEFFNQDYFDSAIQVANLRPDVLFYTYTKSLIYWTKRVNDIPENFILTASYGGRLDWMISEYNLRYCRVVYDESETDMPIDHDDSHAADPDMRGQNFALLIHGPQPAGSRGAKVWRHKRREFGYSR